MKTSKTNINNQRSQGTVTMFQLPDYACQQKRKAKPCTLPPALMIAQINACLQLQMFVHILLYKYWGRFYLWEDRGKKKNQIAMASEGCLEGIRIRGQLFILDI